MHPFRYAAGGYQPAGALMFDGSADYLHRSPGSTTGNKKFTFSCWLKRAKLSTSSTIFSAWTNDTNRSAIHIEDNGFLDLLSDVGGSRHSDLHTTSTYLDPTSWFNLILVYDSTVSTPSGSSIFFMINGTKVVEGGYGELDAHVYPSQNQVTQWLTSGTQMAIGMNNYDDTPILFYSGYMADAILLDGTASTNGSEFGEADEDTGIWVPKDPSDLTFGTNGFWLDFALAQGSGNGPGNDVSGNDNDFTNVSFTAAQTTTDSPTNTSSDDRGNYATFNPLAPTSDITFSLGNTKVVNASTNAHRLAPSTLGVSGGKWYWEYTVDAIGTAEMMLGVSPAEGHSLTSYVGNPADGFAYVGGGTKYNSASSASYGATFTTGDIIGVALDLDNGNIFFSKDGAWQNSATTGEIAAGTDTNAAYTTLSATNTYLPSWSSYGGSGSATINTGQTAFSYTPPTGFKKVNTSHFAEVSKPADFYNTVLWTGDGVAIGSGGQTITGVGFQPDFIYVKQRNSGNYGALYDSCRGVTKLIYPDLANAQGTLAEGVATINSDGFIVGNNSQNNTDSATYIAFCLKAGGAPTADNSVSVANGATMTSGSVFKNGAAHSFTPHDDATIFPTRMTIASHGGFSIIKYEGDGDLGKIPHGLDRAPTCLIVKNLDTSNNWLVQIPGDPTDYMDFDRDFVRADNSEMWNDTAPTADLITVGKSSAASAATNGDGNDLIAYVFANTPGLISTGTYTGNGNASGPFITTNFRPAWLLLKRLDGNNSASVNENWVIHDSVRNPYNPSTTVTISDSNVAERTTDSGGSLTLNVDLLATGFKIKTTSTVVNTSGSPYMYLALAGSAAASNNRVR